MNAFEQLANSIVIDVLAQHKKLRLVSLITGEPPFQYVDINLQSAGEYDLVVEKFQSAEQIKRLCYYSAKPDVFPAKLRILTFYNQFELLPQPLSADTQSALDNKNNAK